MVRRPLVLIALLALSLLVPAATAGAASLVYRDANYNVWVSTPDGLHRKQVTTDGSSDKRYTPPSMDDNGGILTYGHPDHFWGKILDQNGANVRGPWLLPAPVCSLGPLGSTIAPDGKLILTEWIDAGYSATSCLQPGQFKTSVLFGDVATTTLSALPSYNDLSGPRWMARPNQRVAGLINDAIQVQNTDQDTGPMEPWIGMPDPNTADLDSFDFSRVANEVLIESSAEGSGTERKDLELGTYVGSPPDPAATFTSVCLMDGLVASADHPARPRFSPDGTQIAWTAPDGIYVSPKPVAGPGGVCQLSPRLVIPGGQDADWGKADVVVPAPTPAAGGGAPPATGPATSPGPISGTTGSGGTPRSGVAVTTTLAKPATVTVKVERLVGRKRVKVGTVKFKGKAGKNVLRLKKVGGRKLRKGRYRLTVSVPGGAPITLVVTVR